MAFGEDLMRSFVPAKTFLMMLFAVTSSVSLAQVHLSGSGAQELTTTYRAQIQDFRKERTQSLLAPDGWLSLVGLEWLSPGVNTVGSAPDNRVHLLDGTPQHLAVITQSGTATGAELRIASPAGGFPKDLKVDGVAATEGPLSANAKFTFGSYTVLLISRGDRLGLRIKDLNAPTRVHFQGLNWFPVEEAYRIKAKWIPYSEPHAIEIATIIGTTLHEKVPGVAEFTIQGKVLRLEPIIEGDKLFFILRDATSHTTTYEASRFLYTESPSNGLTRPGELTLDFNRLVNPPCAYTVYATCPLPPQQNRLAVAIEAGEKRYHEE